MSQSSVMRPTAGWSTTLCRDGSDSGGASAHELQRHAGAGINVSVFEPGWMPGTALGGGAPGTFQAIGRALGRVPGVSTPQRSGPLLAAMAVDEKWAHLRGGAFVVKTKPAEVRPVAHDRDRERRLWAATAELLKRADAAR